MAVLARSSITLVTSVDIDSVYWFYLLQASTAAAPAKPTTVPATKGNAPSGWTTAEPTTVDINKTLYRVELTYFTDGTGVYSSVNKVSSYEAAKVAYNKATDAKTAADNALINTKYNGPVNIGAAVTANRLIMDATTAANTAASYKMVAKNTAYNIESPILYSKTALSTGSKALADHTCYTIGDVAVTGQGGASSLTVNKPVFLKGTLSGSTFTTVNDATFITQTQPTSSDGYHYIFLGTATSTSNVMLQAEHPLYMFIGGSFHRLGSSSDKILQTWVGGASVAIADAKLNGSYIQANTVTAEQIYVEDLNALGATIGGFVIDSDSIHTVGYGRSSFDYSTIVVGSFNTDGTENTDNTRARTPFLDGNVTNIHNDEDSGDYSFTLLAWDKNTNEFKGYLTNNTNYVFSNNASNVQFFETLNITAVRNANPTYKFRLLIRTTSAPNDAINLTYAVDDLYVSVDNSDSIKLSKSDFSNYINGSRTDWRFTIGSYFGVTKNGYLYASNANISGSGTFGGTINANSGRIGNWTIGSYQSSAPSSAAETKGSLYTGTFGSAGGIYLIPRGKTTSKTIGGGTATDWRFVIGSKFGVRNDGTLYANGANLTGSITAASLNTTDTLTDLAVNESAFSVYRWDHFVHMSASISFDSFDMYMQSWGQASNDWRIRDGYRPPKNIWAPVVWGVNGGFKLAAMEIRSDGWINLYGYETYGGAARNLKTAYRAGSGQYGVDGNNLLFFNMMWFTNQTAT